MIEYFYKSPNDSTLDNNCLIHESAIFGDKVKIGFGVVIEDNVFIGNNVFIGHNTVIRNNTIIGNNVAIGQLVMIESDVIIGDNVTIQPQCYITKYTKVEDWVFFAPRSMCINTYHISHGREFPANLQGPKICFGDRIGAAAVIMPGVVVGREAEIGANSTVTKDCDPYCVYFGSPARKKREVYNHELYRR